MKKLLYIYLFLFISNVIIAQNGFIMSNGGFVLTSDEYTPVAPLDPIPAGYDDGSTDLDLDSLFSYPFSNAITGLQNVTTASAYLDIPGDSPNQGLEEIGSWDTCNRVIDYTAENNKVWRSSQRSGSWGLPGQPTGGPVGAEGGGMNIYIDTNNPTDSFEMYFSQNLRAKPGFYPDKGGKIPGIKSSTDNTSGLPCDGFTAGLTFTSDSAVSSYLPSANGFANYMKFRNSTSGELGTLGTTACESGTISSRVYGILDSLGASPTIDHYIKVYWASGEWFNITMRVALNSSPSNPDGIIEVYFNGLLVQRVSGCLLDTGVDSPGTAIDRIKFYWFFGGGDSSYAATNDEWFEFDDLWGFRYGPSYNGSIVRGRTGAADGTILDLPTGRRDTDGSWIKEQR